MYFSIYMVFKFNNAFYLNFESLNSSNALSIHIHNIKYIKIC